MKIAVIMKDGFEELEALGIVDMARRLDIQCHIIGFGEEYITGSNKVQIKADLMFDQMDDQYDAIVLPGGPGALTLREDERVIELVKAYHQQNKVIGAICAAPIILEKAGVIAGKNITCYPTVKDEIKSANYQDTTTQIDGNIVTGNGPAATFTFAFSVLETLGVNTDALKEGTQYNALLKNESIRE